MPGVVVATAAPAFAASPCLTLVTLNWAVLGNGTAFTSTTVGGITVTLSLTGDTGAANNRSVTAQTGGQASTPRQGLSRGVTG